MNAVPTRPAACMLPGSTVIVPANDPATANNPEAQFQPPREWWATEYDLACRISHSRGSLRRVRRVSPVLRALASIFNLEALLRLSNVRNYATSARVHLVEDRRAQTHFILARDVPGIAGARSERASSSTKVSALGLKSAPPSRHQPPFAFAFAFAFTSSVDLEHLTPSSSETANKGNLKPKAKPPWPKLKRL